jgi:23S rRNA (uridine2552-2'-O)-methyltransferase
MPAKSSKQWLRDHFNDHYVKQAHQDGYRSRAVYKLEEINERYKLFQPGMTIVDLGAAPGSWSQLITKLIGKKGKIIALDILPMDPIEGVDFLQGDFNDEAVYAALLARIPNQKADWVISDMAPNLSGIDSVDQPKSIALAELALEMAVAILDKNGGMLIKVFQGCEFEGLLVRIRQHFKKVIIRKPKASRDKSREVYLLARN